MKTAAYLGFLLVIGVIFILLTNLAARDWRACLNAVSPEPLSWRMLLPMHPQDLWLFYLPVLPLAALTIGNLNPDLRAWIAAGILLAAGMWVMLPSEAMHHCDRKGATADFGLLALAALAFLLMLFVIARRSLAKTQK